MLKYLEFSFWSKLMSVRMLLPVYRCVYVCAYIYICVYIWIFASLKVYLCVYLNTRTICILDRWITICTCEIIVNVFKVNVNKRICIELYPILYSLIRSHYPESTYSPHIEIYKLWRLCTSCVKYKHSVTWTDNQ